MTDETPFAAEPRLWSVNPYAVAEALAGRRIDWSRGRGLLEQLRAIFHVDDPRSLFLTVPDQPSLIALFRQVQRDGPQRWTVKQCLDLIDAQLKPLLARVDVDAVLRALPLLMPALAPGAGPTPPPVMQGYSTLELPPVAADRSYRDPAQGAVADCYLIAALIACAWTRPPKWQEQCAADDRTADGFEWQFFSTPRQPHPLVTDFQLPVGDDGQLIFARSDEGAELWPALIEKAYVLWRCGSAPGAQPSQEEILSIGFGATPGVVTAQMLGCRPVELPNLPATGRGLAAQLDPVLPPGASATSMPSTAWTWPDTHAVWQIDAQAVHDVNGQKMDDFIGLVPNHAYAVLGRAVVDGAAYVFLRDPHSKDLQRPRWLQAQVWEAQFADGRREQVALNRDGVFGLHVDDFDRYFDRLAWARVPL
jgi:hypothetical protein